MVVGASAFDTGDTLKMTYKAANWVVETASVPELDEAVVPSADYKMGIAGH